MTIKERLDPQHLLPLPTVAFHILLSLAEGERHGYAIKRELVRGTDGRVNPGPGVLYGTIRKLLDQGLIEESEDRPLAHLDDERRRYYRLTPFGREVIRAEAARMSNLVRLARVRVGLLDTP